jgi:hypothetical protein
MSSKVKVMLTIGTKTTQSDLVSINEAIGIIQTTPKSSTDCAKQIKALLTLYASGRLTSLVPVLPYFFRLKGQPYTLKDHFVMEPLFSAQMPQSLILKTGRQVTKSSSLAAQGVLLSALIPYFSSLYVCPRFEQTRRFSNNYVRPLLTSSPIGKLLQSSGLDNSVLQRTFTNNSVQHFSYAFLDCSRIRGISADMTRFDECQDIDIDFIPIINETLSHSRYGGITQFAGTPKTFDNTLQALFDKSSQAEWVTKCEHCNYYNCACVELDLLNMIQKDGLRCAKCGKSINPRTGHWEHRYPERISETAGYHIPQAIMPLHYESDERNEMRNWRKLYSAKQKSDKAYFYNEKLGESCDIRVSLLTREDLRKASTLTHTNELKHALALRHNYMYLTMGVDWGGGGEDETSFTTVAIAGHSPTGHSDVIYGERLLSMDPSQEASLLLRYFYAFGCHLFAHDFGGAGSIREILMIQAGLGIQSVFPITYVSASASNMVTLRQPAREGSRYYYSVDKARSLNLLCQLIKHGYIHFPSFISWEPLANDFLALVEDRRELPGGADVYLITRKAGQPNDFANSVNYATLSFWETERRYPDLARQVGIKLTPEIERQLRGD